jgi:flagellar basal body-associated protein FliL
MKRKKILKITIGFFTVLVILVICGGIYLKYFLPDIKVKDLKVEVTKERIERGKYRAGNWEMAKSEFEKASNLTPGRSKIA